METPLNRTVVQSFLWLHYFSKFAGLLPAFVPSVVIKGSIRSPALRHIW
jgi:hypothetical protein